MLLSIFSVEKTCGYFALGNVCFQLFPPYDPVFSSISTEKNTKCFKDAICEWMSGEDDRKFSFLLSRNSTILLMK
jgi:hypothetical protein